MFQKSLLKNFVKSFNVSNSSEIVKDEKNYFEVELKKDDVFALVDKKIALLNQKIDTNYQKLNELFKIGKGMETAANKVFLFKEYPNQFPKEFIKKRMSGEIIKRYEIDGLKEYILYFEDIENFEDLPISIQNHLLENKEYFENGVGKLPIPQIPKDINIYLKNVDYLLNMPKKEKYDKKTRYAIGMYNNKEIYSTEFLVAKQFGYLQKFQGHSELKEYFKLIPFVFSNNMFDEVFQNLDNGRDIYSFFYKKDYRLFHILDENNDLVSFFVNSEKNFNKQLDKKFIFKSAREGGYFSILSPAEPFWRQADLMEQLYQNLKQKSISQNDFIVLVDEIISSKEKISKYKKHFDSLSAVDKIEIKEEIKIITEDKS